MKRVKCPNAQEFGQALDWPLRRESHQKIDWLDSYFKAGCHCFYFNHTQLVCDRYPNTNSIPHHHHLLPVSWPTHRHLTKSLSSSTHHSTPTHPTTTTTTTTTTSTSIPNYTHTPISTIPLGSSNSSSPPPHLINPAKALAATFAAILALALFLIAALLLARRRSSPQSPLLPPHSTRPVPPSPLAPMFQVTPSIAASPHQPSHPFLAPADPSTRYSSNGTRLLSKLRGTTASLQHAGWISPSVSLEDVAAPHSHLAESILTPSSSPPSFNPPAPRYQTIYHPFFTTNPSASSNLSQPRPRTMSTDLDHNPRHSLATDLSYPNGSLPGGRVSSGEIEAVRFGSQQSSGDDHAHPSHLGPPRVHQPANRTSGHSGDGEQAWWGAP